MGVLALTELALPARIMVWIPIRSLGHVNAYLLDEHTIVDPGMLSGRSVLSLARALRERGRRLADIETVVLTHFHVDHSTMTSLLELEASPLVLVGHRDLEIIRGGVESYVRAAAELFRASGVSREQVEEILRNHPALRMRWAYESLGHAEWRPLREGDTIRIGGQGLRVLETPGHTPGSIVLYSEEHGYAITGDTLLPRITPHVTLHSLESDPLGDYLESLSRLQALPARVALPGHRDPIRYPAERASEIIRHHEERLQEILSLLKRLGRATALEVARLVRWRTRYQHWDEYPPHEKFFALGETLAHLRHLETRGTVEGVEKDGTLLWRPLN